MASSTTGTLRTTETQSRVRGPRNGSTGGSALGGAGSAAV